MSFKLEGTQYFHFIDSPITLFFDYEMGRLNAESRLMAACDK